MYVDVLPPVPCADRHPSTTPIAASNAMTLNQLRYLVAIADANLNITLAAQRVHATQPGLSKQLKQLEDELGLQLYLRRGKSLVGITPAGTQVLERARTILDEARNIRALASHLRQSASGSLQVGTTHTQARYVLPPVLARLHAVYPEVGIGLVPGSSEELLSRLRAGQLDLVIISASGDPPADLAALPAYRWDRVVVVPRAHPLAREAAPLTLAALAAHPLVTYEGAAGGSSSLGRAFAAQDLSPRIALTALDGDVLKTYVADGLGVGVLAPMALDRQDRERFAVLDAAHLFPRCTTWILHGAGRVLPRFAQEFVHQLAPHLDPRNGDAAAEVPLWPAGAARDLSLVA